MTTHLELPQRRIHAVRLAFAQKYLRILEAHGRGGDKWIAEQIGVDVHTLGNWRRGTNSPHAASLGKLRDLARRAVRND
jgi:hypothetical protein